MYFLPPEMGGKRARYLVLAPFLKLWGTAGIYKDPCCPPYQYDSIVIYPV